MQRTTSKVTRDKSIERNITSRSGGYSFRVRLYVGGIWITETFDTLEEARAFRDRKRADFTTDPTAKLVLQSQQAKRDAIGVSLSTLLDRYAKEITPSKKGAASELNRINKLKTFEIAKLPIHAVDRTALIRFMDKLSATPVSQNTVRKYLMLISAMYTTAVRRWALKLENPVRQVEIPSNGPSRSRRLEPDEYEYLHTELLKIRESICARLFELAIETTARRGELLKLLWSDVDMEAGIAVLRDTKNGENRIIPLSSKAKNTLSAIRRSENDFVFPVKPSQVRTAFTLAKKRGHKRYQEDCAASGAKPDLAFLNNLRFHDLRHEGASRLFEIGLDVMEVASVTGHKTLSMLRGYTHLRAQNLAEKLDRLA